MALTIEYTAAQKKKLYDAGWNGRGSEVGAVRSIKMVRPICKPCQSEPYKVTTWWSVCPHRGEDGLAIYWSQWPKVIKTQVIGKDDEGDMALLNTVTRTKIVVLPNVTEVIQDEGKNIGRGPEKMRVKGFLFMEEAKLAPMCQMYGCGRSWPTVRTEEYGDYCSEYHAKLCVATAEGIVMTEIIRSKKAEQVRKAQLREVYI